AVVDPFGKRTEYGYDAAGRKTSMKDALGHVTRYEYDPVGNMTKIIYPDDTFASATYDRDNRKLSETDANGQTTDYEYNASGLLTAVILPAVPDPQHGNQLTRPRYDYTYDMYGDKLSMRDPLGRVTTYTYDPAHHQLSETLPDGETSYNVYDRYGRLIR